MPDLPGTRYLTDLTLRQHLRVLRQAAREYLDGWRWYNGEPEKERKERLAAERAARAEEARDITRSRRTSTGPPGGHDDVPG